MRFYLLLVVTLFLPGCDYLQQHFGDKVTVTLEIDRDWAFQSKFKKLRDDLQAYLKEKNLHYLSIQQQDDTLLIKYHHDPSHDWPAELSLAFPEFTFAETDRKLESQYHQIVASIPARTRSDLFAGTRDFDANAVVRMLASQGVMAETQPIGLVRFKLHIPRSKYSRQLLASFTKSSTLGFYLEANHSSNQTFPVTDQHGNRYMLERPSVISGEAIISARASIDRFSGQPSLSVVLGATAANKMESFTRQNLGRRMAVVLLEQGYGEARTQDPKQVRVLSVATIQGVFSKRFMITGLNDSSEAHQLATYLLAGGLATPLRIIDEK